MSFQIKQQEICMLSLSWPQRLQVLNNDKRYLIFLYLIWGCLPWPSTKQDLSPDHDLQIVLMALLLCLEAGQTGEQGRLELLVQITDLGKDPFLYGFLYVVCGSLYVSFFDNMDMCWIEIHWTPSPCSIPLIQAKAVLQHLRRIICTDKKHWKMFLNGSVDSLLNFEEQ